MITLYDKIKTKLKKKFNSQLNINIYYGNDWLFDFWSLSENSKCSLTSL